MVNVRIEGETSGEIYAAAKRMGAWINEVFPKEGGKGAVGYGVFHLEARVRREEEGVDEEGYYEDQPRYDDERVPPRGYHPQRQNAYPPRRNFVRN